MIRGVYLLPGQGRRQRRARWRFFRYLILVLVLLGLIFALSWRYIRQGMEPIDDIPAEPSSAVVPESSVVVSTAIESTYSLAAAPPDDASEDEQPSAPIVSLNVPPEILGETATVAEDAFFDDALFIGDSITTGLDKVAAFDKRPVLADIGLTLYDANEKVTDYADLKPSKIFILLGANDLTYYNMTEELYVERYQTLIATLKRLFPQAAIYPQSILPLSAKYNGNPALTNERITSYNKALSEFCTKQKLRYIDIGALWRLPDDSLHPAISTDGLHISYLYYGTWLTVLKNSAE